MSLMVRERENLIFGPWELIRVRPAILYEKKANGRAGCYVCPRYCLIAPGKLGVCLSRKNFDGELFTLLDDYASSIAVDPIEKKPLFHFYPGTKCLSIGSLGCNFRCIHCQNWQIAHTGPEEASECKPFNPQMEYEYAIQNDCSGVAWTYNEPVVWLEYTIDSSKFLKERDLYTVYVTNGYITEEALDEVGPYLTAYRVDIKGFTDYFYRKLASIKEFSPILKAAKRAKFKWDLHVEIVTNIIPTMNDDDEQLKGIANWIVAELGPETPWHVTRFFPYLKLQHLPPTPIQTLERAYEIGRSAGLQYVYLGNVQGHSSENTYCPTCGRPVIERRGFETDLKNLSGNNCIFCNEPIFLRR